MIKRQLYLLIFGCMIFSGCADTLEEGWTVLYENSGTGKDGIPSIDNPTFIPISEVDFLENNDLVIGHTVGNEIKAYPHRLLDWHEIVNDDIGGENIAITYCPLTGTSVGFSRDISRGLTTFGTSGLLHNSNLIFYDRKTNSNWSQFKLECVNGDLINETPTVFTVLETTWETWKTLYPTSQILSDDIGMNRNYNVYPYGDYKTNNTLLFDANPKNDGLSNGKERVYGVVAESSGKKIAKIYRFQAFGEGVTTIQETFGGKDYVVVGDSTRNFITAFERTINGAVLDFLPIQNGGAKIMTDNEGNQWDIFGKAVVGPRTGEQLTPTTSFMGYWFAWAAFYPNITIYDE